MHAILDSAGHPCGAKWVVFLLISSQKSVVTPCSSRNTCSILFGSMEDIILLRRSSLSISPSLSEMVRTPSSMKTEFLTSPLRILEAVHLPWYILAIRSLASSTFSTISPSTPASTASPILDLELGSLQRMLIASSIASSLAASDIFSWVYASPRMFLNGETSWLKNESIVPTGASSSWARSISGSPTLATLDSSVMLKS